MRVRRVAAFIIFGVCASLAAQQIISLAPQQPAAVPAGPTGSVTGHVTCADTRHPARIASVMLQPVVTPDPPADGLQDQKATLIFRNTVAARTPVVQTLMDGSFTINGIAPGEYYIVAELPGYVSPLSLFTREDLNHPTEPMVKLMESLLTKVTVTANATAQADVSLVKGGSISGTVQYEDGMPGVGSRVVLQRRPWKGSVKNYYPATLTSAPVNTDDQGRFRFAGLPEGEYRIYAILSIQNTETYNASNWQGGTNIVSNPASTSSLNVFYPDSLGRPAKSIELKGVEDSVDDIDVPLTKLHSVSGSVTDAATGAPVNSGSVTIVWPAGGDFQADAQVSRVNIGEDGSFHFAFIPEGEYKLNVVGARQIVREDMPFSATVPPGFAAGFPDSLPRMVTVQKQGQAYADAQQPLGVHNDVAGVTVTVIAKPPAKANSASQ